MKLSRYNIKLIVLILIGSQLIAGGTLYLFSLLIPALTFQIAAVFLLLLFAFQILALLFYEKLNTDQIKRSFGRFIKQIKKGNFESEKSHIIQKYDFVQLTDIQIELSNLVGQIRADYKEQKRYIENVSHELMTPIAIIRGKLELLIQSKNIEKQDFKLINDILLKLDRLTRVNQALVLLSKIDYNHYQNKSLISFNQIVDETIDLFEDQIRVDKLAIRKEIKADVTFKMNENLAYILIKNIIKNAVIHNIENGYIRIQQIDRGLSITNSGAVITSSTHKLFERFQVGGNNPDSIGLGLSIISRICEVSHIKLSYKHTNGEHTVEIRF